MVNRLWAEHFGRGLVSTPANFGKLGDEPTHPELLDWLATEFVRSGWSLKGMHRLMVTSQAYRQSSSVAKNSLEEDPDNKLVSRMPMRRMTAEMLYDSILSVTGRLDPKRFGPPAEVEVQDSGEAVAKGSREGWRRAVYTQRRRSTPVTLMDAYDLPQLSPNCTERGQSIVATQALQLMNGASTRNHAQYLAGRLLDEHPRDRDEQIQQLYLRVYSRRPTPEEASVALRDLAGIENQWVSQLEEQRDAAPAATNGPMARPGLPRPCDAEFQRIRLHRLGEFTMRKFVRDAGRPTSARVTRRGFFSRISDGVHGAALAALLSDDLFAASQAPHPAVATDLRTRAPHFEPRAKSVIHLFMNGGPSQVDLFDFKPELKKYRGQASTPGYPHQDRVR